MVESQLNTNIESGGINSPKEHVEIKELQPDLTGVDKILDKIRDIPLEYREGYYNQEVVENGELLVFIDELGIKGEDIYGKYANTSLADLIKSKALDGIIVLSHNFSLERSDIDLLKFDSFNQLSKQEKVDTITSICKQKGVIINGDISDKIDTIRDCFVLGYNNARLKSLGISQKIEVRKEVAERVSLANAFLNGTGYSIGISNGLRTSLVQKTIKENHELFKGKQESDRLFASEDNSPHLSGGAIDVFLMKNGKKIDLKLGNNSAETKSPTYQTDNPQEMDILKSRHILLVAMNKAGFNINPTEYWHFCYGDKMWAYIQEKNTGVPTKAMYDNVNK